MHGAVMLDVPERIESAISSIEGMVGAIEGGRDDSFMLYAPSEPWSPLRVCFGQRSEQGFNLLHHLMILDVEYAMAEAYSGHLEP